MQQLDSTVIANALPAISQSIGAEAVTLDLAITSYLLSVAVFIPISGWVADKFGGKLVFRIAIAVFTLSSILCGFADSLGTLVAGRILQGMGGAMMVPVGRLVILKTVPKSDLVRAMTFLTTPAIIAPVLGPPIGGYIVTYGSWRWIFFMNAPIGLLGILLVTLFMEEVREKDAGRPDLPGFVLTGIGLAGLVFGFETMGRGMIPPWAVAALLVGGSLAMTLYWFHAKRVEQPIINFGLFRHRTFLAAVFGGNLCRFGQGSLPFLLAMMLQLGFGYSAFLSGILTFSSAAGALCMKMTVGPIIRKFGFRNVLIYDTVIIALFFLAYASITGTTPYWAIMLVLLVGGFFRSLQFTSLASLTYADIPAPMMSRATSLASMAQQLAQSIGVGLTASIVHLSLMLRGGETVSAEDVRPAFVALFFFTTASLYFFRSLDPAAGEELTGRGKIKAP